MKSGISFWFQLTLGILLIILGIVTCVNLSAVLSGMIVLYAVFTIITGLSDLTIGVRLGKSLHASMSPAIIISIISILAAVLIFFTPVIGRWALGVFLAIWFICHCVTHLLHLHATPAHRRDRGSSTSTILYALGVLLGIIMLFNPLSTALSVSLLIGIVFLILGIRNVVSAFKGQ